MTLPPRASLLERWDALGRPFPHLPRWAAALVLALVAAAMAWSALARVPDSTLASAPGRAPPSAAAAPTPAPSAAGLKGDMALYARVAVRVARGEPYHAAALEEHRRALYPTRPFVAVRLPTLAMVQALVGTDGVRWLGLGVVAALLWALDRRLAGRAAPAERLVAAALVLGAGGALMSPAAGLDHDFLAGLLLSLALALHRPDRWGPALIAAGAALAVRELAAPFVLLWLAFALAERRRREALAIVTLLALFAAGLALHAEAVAAARLPGDLASQGWQARAGFAVPLAALGELTGLRLLPPALAMPLAILPLIGWAAIGGRIGLFATLWSAGLATMIALFARPENYYWVELALPAYGIGLAFAPRGLGELAGRLARQT